MPYHGLTLFFSLVVLRLVTFFISIAWLCFYKTNISTRVALGIVVVIASILVALTLYNGNWNPPTRSELVSRKLAIAASQIKKTTKSARKSLRTMSRSIKTKFTSSTPVKRKSKLSGTGFGVDDNRDLEANRPSPSAEGSSLSLGRITGFRPALSKPGPLQALPSSYTRNPSPDELSPREDVPP